MAKLFKEEKAAPLFTKRRMLIVLVVVVVFSCLGVAGAYFLNKPKEAPAPDQQTAELDGTSKFYDQVASLVVDGEAAKARQLYDEKIATEGDKTEKSYLMLGKASTYLDEGKLDEALKLALEAENLKESSQAAGLIARIYEKKDDKPKAVQYYQKTIKLMDPKQTMYASDKRYYESRIKELQG